MIREGSKKSWTRWARKRLVAQLIAFGAVVPVVAQDIGFEGPAFTGAGTTPTEAKPESKLWFNDGIWWGSLWSTSASAFRIHRLDFTTHAWTDTGVAVESRPNSHSDALWDGTKLYIASHQFVANGGASGNPIRVFRYSYNTTTDAYSLDAGFPVTIGDFSTEALVIAKDSTGVVWAAWTQGLRVRISHTLASDTQWSASALLPSNTANINVDDICSIVSYGGNRIGVLWSDQSVNAYRFSFHVDGAADTVWSAVENATTGETDDHLNMKAHSDGRVFVVGKNVANNLLLLVRATNGTWSRFVVTQPTPILTRPIVLLDEPGNLIRVFATGQDTGEVFEKTSPISSISFATGTGTIRMRDASTVFRISNPTSTKQNLDSTTGLVVLAHHDTTGFYWHHEVAPVSTPPPIQTLLPVADARVNEASPSSNSGTATEIRVRFAAGGSYHSYLRFDLTRVLEPVVSAKLRLFCTDDSPVGGLVFPTSNSWSETAITWANKPAATGGQVASLGAVTLGQWVEVDLTGAVDGGRLVSFVLTSTSSNSALFSSREGTNPPALVVETGQSEAPVADFDASPTSGVKPLLVGFTDTSTGSITSRSWSFGDGGTSTATNPSHTYLAAGTYTVSLTVTGAGGSDTETKTDLIQVSAPTGGRTLLPVADSRVDESAPGSNYGTSPEMLVRAAAGSSVQTYLRFDLTGVGAVASARLRLFCTDGSPVGGLVFPTSSGWSETGINWTNKPAATGGQIASLGTVVKNTWVEVDVTAAVVGGGLRSFLVTSTKSNSALYSSREGANPPELVIATGSPTAPVAEFTATPLTGSAPLAVSFTDQSTGAPTSWAWTFGDGGTSSAASPVHVYTTPGLYTVTLQVSNGSGNGQITKVDLVDVGEPSPVQPYLPVADARVNEGNPASNYGTSPELRVRFEAGGSYHTYLRFDLTRLSGTVTSAKLRLFCTDGSPVGGLFFPTSNTWSETGITWTNKPAATGGQLASLGTVATGAWAEVDVTSAIVGLGTVSFLVTSSSSNSALYSSREGTQPPELIVTTTGP